VEAGSTTDSGGFFEVVMTQKDITTSSRRLL